MNKSPEQSAREAVMEARNKIATRFGLSNHLTAGGVDALDELILSAITRATEAEDWRRYHNDVDIHMLVDRLVAERELKRHSRAAPASAEQQKWFCSICGHRMTERTGEE